MPRFTRDQRKAFEILEAHFARPLAEIDVRDLHPDPNLAAQIGLPNMGYGPPPHTADQHKRLLYQAFLCNLTSNFEPRSAPRPPRQDKPGRDRAAA